MISEGRCLVRVGLVDEQPLFLRALQRELSKNRTIEVLLLEPTPTGWPRAKLDVLVCDPWSLDRFRGDLLQTYLTQTPPARILVLSGRSDESSVSLAMADGLVSYILKSESIDAICNAVSLASQGAVVLSATVAAQLTHKSVGRLTRTTRPTPRDLSPRELEVMRLVVSGMTDSEISEQLGTSTRTVQRQVSSVLVKLNCRNRSEAVVRVLESAAVLSANKSWKTLEGSPPELKVVPG